MRNDTPIKGVEGHQSSESALLSLKNDITSWIENQFP